MGIKKFGINGLVIIARAATGKTTFLNDVKFSEKYKNISNEVKIFDEINYGYTVKSIATEERFILGADNSLSEENKKLIKRKNIMVFYDVESAEHFLDLLMCINKNFKNNKEMNHFKDMLFFYSLANLLITFEDEFTITKIIKISKKVYGSNNGISVLNFLKDKRPFLDTYIEEIGFSSLSKKNIYQEVMDFFSSKFEKENLKENIKANTSSKGVKRI